MAHRVAIVGGGPAGLAAAERLAEAGVDVVVFEQMATVGRKLLMAGRGGLNLTHGEPLETFLTRYGESRDWLRPMIEAYPPDHVRAWADELGEQTFVGSSGRVFPKAMKASPLLRAWIARLTDRGVDIRTRHRWVGFADGGIVVSRGAETEIVPADAVILALGGRSWPRLGSDGTWTELLASAGVDVTPLAPSNAGVAIGWSSHVLRHAGAPLKRIAVAFDGQSVRGEAVITRTGLEGGAIYQVVPGVRDALARSGSARLTIDLRPDLDIDTLAADLAAVPRKSSLSTRLGKGGRLSPAAIAVLREPWGAALPPDPGALAAAVKSAPLTVTAIAGFERAISTAGGIARSAVDADLMLRAHPGIFVAGEMLDWDAPTGGYLLQATLATGRWAAEGVLRLLAGR